MTVTEVSTRSQRSQQNRAIRTREKLLQSGALLFESVGFSATTVSEIVDHAGTTKGGMYFHFPSKEALAQTLVTEFVKDLDEALLRVMTSGDSKGRLDDIFRVFLDLANMASRSVKFRTGLMLTLDRNVNTNMAFNRFDRTIGELVTAATDRMELSPDCLEVMRLSWNLCSGFVGAVQTSGGGPDALQCHVRDMVESHVEYARGKSYAESR